MARHSNWTEDLYDAISGDEDSRVCKAISDKACQEVPGNFFRILGSLILTGLGDRLANPKTTLAWLLQAVGAPSVFLACIVPVRESGSLLPQMFLAGYLRRLPVRKWVWVVGAALQGIAIAGCAVAGALLTGSAAGATILGLMVLFSLARGLSSIASKDVLGKTIPKSRRGLLSGWKSSIGGVLAIAVGISLLLSQESEETSLYAVYLLGAAALWILAALLFCTVREFSGETSGGGNAWQHARQKLALLRTDRAFRDFVMVRSLAIGSGLSAPFVISLSHDRLGGGALWLGLFIIVDGLAAMLSAPLWGRFADRSSRTVLRCAMGLTAAILLLVVVIGVTPLPDTAVKVAFPTLFFALGGAHSGVRLGRKTYLVDMAEGDKRTDYVAVSNSVIGLVLLSAGAITGALSLLSTLLALGVFALCAVAGALLGSRLPDVSA